MSEPIRIILPTSPGAPGHLEWRDRVAVPPAVAAWIAAALTRADEAEAAIADERKAWQAATGCDEPGDAAAGVRLLRNTLREIAAHAGQAPDEATVDAVKRLRKRAEQAEAEVTATFAEGRAEGHAAERKAWQEATGCATPAGAHSVERDVTAVAPTVAAPTWTTDGTATMGRLLLSVQPTDAGTAWWWSVGIKIRPGGGIMSLSDGRIPPAHPDGLAGARKAAVDAAAEINGARLEPAPTPAETSS